jgi:hypothetical protein
MAASGLICMALTPLTGCAGIRGFAHSPASTAHRPTATVATNLAKVTFWPGSSSTYPYPTAFVSFAPGTTFVVALHLVTDLGLQPLSPCSGAGFVGAPWYPVDEQDSYFGDPSDPGLWVHGAVPSGEDIPQSENDPDAAPDWLGRLSQLAAVTKIYDGGPGGCPLIEPGTTGPMFPDPNTPSFYLSVTFVATTSYDQALFTLSDLGFRLADPCYEQSKTAAWHPMGQETSFDHSHQLLVATTWANSTTWSTQVGAASGVINVASYVAGNCGA